MKKFGLDSIKGFDKIDDINEQLGDEYKFGSGLLNDASKGVIKLNITNIERDKIKRNPKNNYNISEIDTLAESIKIYGIVNPLNVKKNSDGTYTLLGGERRITAIDKLIEDTNVPDWNEYTLIPCVVKDLDNIDLPLSDEMKENFALITTNKESRKYTDADRIFELRMWKEIISELRNKGVDIIDNVQGKGSIQIKGEKTLDILNKVTGISRGQLQKFNKVEKDADPELLNAILHNDISIGVAEKATELLSPDEQKNLAHESKKKKINPTDVANYKNNSDKIELTKAQFAKDIAQIRNILDEGNTSLTQTDKREYDKLIKKLNNLIQKNSGSQK